MVVEEELETKPPIQDGNFNVLLSVEEMFSLVQILGFSKEIFEKMSDNCRISGDEKAMEVYAARSELSLLLWHKLKVTANIGEPSSREVH